MNRTYSLFVLYMLHSCSLASVLILYEFWILFSLTKDDFSQKWETYIKPVFHLRIDIFLYKLKKFLISCSRQRMKQKTNLIRANLFASGKLASSPFSTKRILSRESTFHYSNWIDPSLVPAENSQDKRKSRFARRYLSSGKWPLVKGWKLSQETSADQFLKQSQSCIGNE